MRTRTLSIAGGLLLSLSLFTGCGGSDPAGEPDVASLRSSGAPPASASPSAGVRERPVIRPDEGKEAWERYVAIYHQCIRDQGVEVGEGEKPYIEPNAKSKAAIAKCEHLYPENWMERERRTNPDFVDLLRKTAQCLKAKGHDVTVGGDPVSILYGDNTSANEAYEDEQACQREAFKESVEKYEQG